MQVEFERSGGFAGMRLMVSISTDTLPEAEAKELRRLVESAGFFDLPAEINDSAAVADQFVYRVTVDEAGQRHSVKTGESAAPESLRPLLEWLTRAARKGRGGADR